MKLKPAIAVIAIVVSLACAGRATAQSIDEQIKQKEAELQRLREIKVRLDKIKQLQDEVNRLQAGQDVTVPAVEPAKTQPPTGKPSPAVENRPAANQPARSATGPQPAAPVLRAAPVPANVGATTNAASDPTLPSLRACADVEKLSEPQTSRYEQFFCFNVAQIQDQKAGRGNYSTANPRASFDLVHRDFLTFMIALLAREGRAQYIIAAENERNDKQVGADSSSGGSTSLVSKGSVPAILGFAVDNGGLLKSTNGSTVTFRGNVAGVAKALAAKGFISGYDEDTAATRFLRRTSFSFSFDTSRGSLPGTFVGDKQQISNYSLRLDIYNKRDPRAPRYRSDWKEFLAKQSESLVLEIQRSQEALLDIRGNTFLDSEPALSKWFTLANLAMQQATEADVEAVYRDQLNSLPKDLAPTTVARIRSFDTRVHDWLDARERILDKIAKAPIVTFEYINDHPQNASSLSKFNWIAEGGFGPRLDLTFNGALTIFNQTPALLRQGRVRDFQFAGEFEVPFGEIGLGLGKPVLSFAGRYERLMSNATTAAGTFAPNTRGDIGVGQVKLTIPIKNSGIRIPISFSFANRTELIKEKERRGNFGFTFDPDTLFAIFKPFSK